MKTNIINTIFLVGLFSYSFSFLLPFNLRNIPVLIFAIVIVASLFKVNLFKKIYFKPLLLNSFFYITMSSSILYTIEIGYGLTKVLLMLPLFIMPICFYLITSKGLLDYDQYEKYIFIVFFSSTVLFFLGVLVQNYSRGFINETIFTHYAERLNSKYGKYSIHPLYASMYVIISLVFSIPIYTIIKRKAHKILLILSVIFLMGVLLLLARKGPIIIAFVILLFYIIKNKNRKKNIIYYFLAVILFGLIVSMIEPIRNRFIELFNVVLNNSLNNIGSTSIRLRVYDCSIKAIKNSPFFGYGIGDVKSLLSECYTRNSISYYNSHNQFLSAWLSAGFIGFISLVFIFFQGFQLAFKSKDFVYFSIVFLFFIMAMTENILERQDGVLLFSFFINFYAFKTTSKQELIK